MGSVSCGFNREKKKKNYCDGSKRWYSEIRQKLKGFRCGQCGDAYPVVWGGAVGAAAPSLGSGIRFQGSPSASSCHFTELPESK